jgi:hydrophobic/amphiphilic exporter-1 (mainly G- bacteria), HAE1 family
MNIFRRRYLISLFYLLVLTIGLTAWMRIPMELAPNIQLPTITISHSWGSTSPEVMEQEVTRKVEQVASRLRDVEKISSITSEGTSRVTVTFRKNAPVDFRTVEIQEYLFAIRDALPQSLVQMPITRSVPQELSNMTTFMTWSVHADLPPRYLLELAERSIRLPLMGLDGLSEVTLQGVREPSLSVVFDMFLLEQLNLSPQQLLAQVRQNLQWRSAGFSDTNSGRFTIMVPPQFVHTQDIEQMPIRLAGSERQIRLGDVAKVQLQDYPDRQIKRVNGNTALTVRFEKESGADALILANEIRSRMERIQTELPDGVELRLEQDNTERLRKQLDELQLQSIYSILSVFLVLLAFIRRFRAPFIILGSIVFSILISVTTLYLMGITINVLTLAGITVAIGMIIDNAVVVFEYVNPGMPAGREQRLIHMKNRLGKAVVPVLGSTLTTVGIFIPLLFAMEEIRMFLVPLAQSLSFTLLASVLVSLTWIPYSIIWLVPPSIKEKKKSSVKLHGWMKRIGRSFSLVRIFHYRRKLRWVLTFTLLAAIGLPTFTIKEPTWSGDSLWRTITKPYFENKREVDKWVGGVTYQFFNKTYFGEPWGSSQGERIFVSINTPQGTPLEEIDKIARNFELISEPYTDAFEFFETTVSEQFGARLIFHVKDEMLVQPEPYILYAELAYLAARTGNSRISVSGLGDSYFSGGGSFSQGNIRLKGYSYTGLEETARMLQTRLERNRRVENVDINQTGFFSRGDLQQYFLQLDESQIVSKGMNRRNVLDVLQVDINPENIQGRVEFQGQRMYLMGVGERRNQYWMDFRDRPRNYDNTFFTMGEIAELEKRDILSEIRREDQSYSRTIAYDFMGPPQMANTFRESILEQFPFPIGITYENNNFWSFGQSEQRKNMLFVMLMALLSVWMIVSALLERWRDPFVVIMAVPLSLLGVMSGILFHESNFGQGAIAGTLLSVGVVVNNAILLIHDKDELRKLGIWGIRSWVHVYKNRIRAILITSLTTIAGLLPLIIVGTDPFWNDLAIVVCWGLGFSTILILTFAGMWGK